MSLDQPLRSIAAITDRRTRSISPENFTGAPGQGGRAVEGTGSHYARDLGVGWKLSPSVIIEPGERFTLADIDGAGCITHIWATTHVDNWRSLVFRAHWDGASEPAIEVPYGDFFCNGLGQFAQVNSLPIAANPNGGFNSYWPMPFRESALLTVENLGSTPATVYYQVTYEEGPTDGGYLHAQWRRSNPVEAMTNHTLLEGVTGRGHFAGCYIAWGSNSRDWWGEGEVKVFLDGDDEYPTICGTGTEDYFGGAWNFDVPGNGYTTFSTPFLGMPQVIRPDGAYDSQQRFGMYRWHLADPIRFATDLRVEIQALGIGRGERFRPLRDDVASMSVFYLDAPGGTPPPAPTYASMEP